MRPRRIMAVLSAAAIFAAPYGALAQFISPPQSLTQAPDAVPSASPSLSPDVLAIIAPVGAAIDKIKAKQAALPPPATDRDRLLRLRDLDQAAWQAVSSVDFSKIPADQKADAKALIGSQVGLVDQANEDALLAMLPPEGWFAISHYSADGEEAAYLVVLHSDIDMWRRFVPVVGRFAAIGEANGGHFARLSDRLAVHEGRAQSYGSQIQCVDGVYKPYLIEDPEHLDERRLRLGMEPYAAFQKSFAGKAC